jgi:hypothetical protein
MEVEFPPLTRWTAFVLIIDRIETGMYFDRGDGSGRTEDIVAATIFHERGNRSSYGMKKKKNKKNEEKKSEQTTQIR